MEVNNLISNVGKPSLTPSTRIENRANSLNLICSVRKTSSPTVFESLMSDEVASVIALKNFLNIHYEYPVQLDSFLVLALKLHREKVTEIVIAFIFESSKLTIGCRKCAET